MRVLLIVVMSAVILKANAWSSVRNPFETKEPQPSYHTISECMHVTSEEGDYFFTKSYHHHLLDVAADAGVYKTRRSSIDEGVTLLKTEDDTPSMGVCGLYVVSDPNKNVEITITYLNVNCESGGLMAFVDGWELNGQYFPSIQDHQMSLDKRISEFCNDNQFWPFSQKHRVFRSSQNSALLQYRIPIRGSFIASVRFVENPKPCHILAEGVAPFYTLKNFGMRDNCTLTALYPAVVAVESISVGKPRQEMSFNCEDETVSDKLEVGGSSGLDSHLMEMASTACGHSDSVLNNPIEQAIFCGVTTIRLSSSGNYMNHATVSIRPADETDLDIATLVCQL